MKKKYCKGYKEYLRNRIYVIKKPFINWEYLKDSKIQIGYIDNIPVCAVDNKGFLSCLEFDNKGGFKHLIGVSFFTGGSRFKNKLNAMKSAYLHVPIFFGGLKGKIKSFHGKYYDIDIDYNKCENCNLTLCLDKNKNPFCPSCIEK